MIPDLPLPVKRQTEEIPDDSGKALDVGTYVRAPLTARDALGTSAEWLRSKALPQCAALYSAALRAFQSTVIDADGAWVKQV
jgi:hypothetical protein